MTSRLDSRGLETKDPECRLGQTAGQRTSQSRDLRSRAHAWFPIDGSDQQSQRCYMTSDISAEAVVRHIRQFVGPRASRGELLFGRCFLLSKLHVADNEHISAYISLVMMFNIR